MHFKASLLAGLVAASSAIAQGEQIGQNQINIHRQFKINNEICATKQPITVCQAGFKPIYEQENQRSVEMYCLEENHQLAHHMAQAMETGHRLKELQQESTKRTHQVPKVIRCKTTGLTKRGEIEDNTQMSQQQGDNFNQSRKQFQSKQEREQYYETVRSEQQQKYRQLQKLMPTIEKAIQLSQSEYEQAKELAKSIAHKDQQVEGILYMLQSQLPTSFVQAVHRLQEELTTDNMSEDEQKKVHEQLKQLSQRVYIYTLLRLHQQEVQQPIREQIEQYQNWEQFEDKFQRVWEQIKREMGSDRQGEKIIKAVERKFNQKFERQITEEQKDQLQAWELNLQKDQKNQQSSSWGKNQEQSWEQPQQVEQQMTRQQHEKQQQQLTKIMMASLLKTERMQKESQNQGSPLFSLFNKNVNYEKLTKQVKNQFDTEY